MQCQEPLCDEIRDFNETCFFFLFQIVLGCIHVANFEKFYVLDFGRFYDDDVSQSLTEAIKGFKNYVRALKTMLIQASVILMTFSPWKRHL